MSTYYTFTKIIDIKNFFNLKLLIVSISTFLISLLSVLLKYSSGTFTEFLSLIILLSIVYSSITKNDFTYCIIFTVISLSINYILFFFALTAYFLSTIIFPVVNDYLILILTMIIHTILIILLFRIKKFKHGFTFLTNALRNEYFKILLLNISVIILFSSLAFTVPNQQFTTKMPIAFITFSIIMFITIKKSFEIYYKQNLLIKELEETKQTLAEKEEEIKKLEVENLKISKTNHTISHKQKSLEYKLNELIHKNEIAEEIDVRDRINKLSNKLLEPSATIELTKTNIPEIDDMLKFMQSECIKNNIDFELQINGDIYHMINNFIDKENLEILIADLIKNAIIAVKHSDNINRSILVRFGIIDENYSLYVYDSGIEFKIDTLSILGQKACTTHSDSGGSGMGFLNIFDTLNKFNASMTINELNLPSKDN